MIYAVPGANGKFGLAPYQMKVVGKITNLATFYALINKINNFSYFFFGR